MANKIRNILKNKVFTGKEVGLAILKAFAYDIETQGSKGPLFSTDEIKAMVEGLKTARDFEVYQVYNRIYSGLVEKFNRTQVYVQQFYSGFYRALNEIQSSMNTEQNIARLMDMPLVLTPEQYAKAKDEATARQREYPESYFSLVFHALDYFLNNPDQQPEAIKKALDATKDQPATDQAAIDGFHLDIGDNGYYTFKGKRGDQMSQEEWLAWISQDTPEAEEAEKNHARNTNNKKLLYQGADAIKEAYQIRTGKELSGSDETIEADFEAVIEEKSPNMMSSQALELKGAFMNRATGRPEWHNYAPDEMEHPSKFEIIENSLERYDRTTAQTATQEREHFKAFKNEYPDLLDALDTYVRSNVAATKDLKANQLYKDVTTWGELADTGVLNFPDLITANRYTIMDNYDSDTTKDLIARQQILRAGIAVIAEPGAAFSDPNQTAMEITFSDGGLEGLLMQPDQVETINQYTTVLIMPALRALFAYNAFIDVLAKVYGASFIKVAKGDTDYIEGKIEAYNGLLAVHYQNINGTESDKKAKREVMKEAFPYIDINDLKPTPAAVEVLEEQLDNLGYSSEAAEVLDNMDVLIRALAGKGARI